MAKFLCSPVILILISILDNFYLQHASANQCDEDLFYQPYVLIKKKKNGGDISSLRRPGFLDLRFRNRILLCINGPAVLYSEAERLDPNGFRSDYDQPGNILGSNPNAQSPSPDNFYDTGDENNIDSIHDELRFSKGELKVFNHECISVNKVPTNMLKRMKEEQGRSNPELFSDTPVAGKLVLGVFLVGDKNSYQEPELAWFRGPNWEFIKSRDKSVKDSSFIIVNSQVAHCIKLPDGTQVKISAPTDSNGDIQVCKWTVQEKDRSWYATIFQRGFDSHGFPNGEETWSESDYEFYECPDSDPERNIILTMSQTTPEPVIYPNYTEFDPFSFFNPNAWTPHGYRRDSNGLSGGDERPDDRLIGGGIIGDDDIPCTMDATGCDYEEDEDEEIEVKTLKDMQNVDPIMSSSFEIIAGQCITLPTFKMSECGGNCEYGNRDYGNRILELVLELDPLEPEKVSNTTRRKRQYDPDDPPKLIDDDTKRRLPKWGNLDSNEHLKWKMDILIHVADIFSHLCMPFRADFAYTVARVFGWYVLRAHAYGENMGKCESGADEIVDSQFDHLIIKTDTWVILEKELERCMAVARNENGGKGLKFQWEVGETSGKWKIPAVNGGSMMNKRRKKRSVDQAEYPTYNKRKTAFKNPFFEEERILSRTKRSHGTKDGPKFTNKYILPGKHLTVIKSEGASGYVREVIQEYKSKHDLNDPRADSSKYCDYPQNIQHCWNPQQDSVTKKIVCSYIEYIFFYEDRAEIDYELNIAIDLWWKIWATVIGYCNKAYHSRKSETFPRLYNSKYEYFFELVQKEWKHPQDNEDLKIIFSEYLTEESHVWLDSCLEGSYINSNSHSYRPPRPLTVEGNGKEESNYFEEVPAFLYHRYHPEPSINM